MKSIKMLLALLPFLMLTLFSCHKNDDNSNGGVQITPASGTWKVSYFFDTLVNKIQTIEAGELQSLAQNYLKMEDWTTVIVS